MSVGNTNNLLTENAKCMEREIRWFHRVMDWRLEVHGSSDEKREEILKANPPPVLPEQPVPYADVVRRFQMNADERLVLILAMLPHLQPDALDALLVPNPSLGKRYTEFGGLTGAAHAGLLPTCETAMFLLCGRNLSLRLHCHHLFTDDHFLFQQGILEFNHQHYEEPRMSSALQLSAQYREQLITGRSYIPPFSPEFPAQPITTELEKGDLVLNLATEQEIDYIVDWVHNESKLLTDWKLKRILKPGYRALFYGPPGTGKTTTAGLLGKRTGCPVFRIDLSKVVSKYIGETEKNLAKLFDQAQNRKWILFFDEADSLFGKRTESRNSNDRAMNQQISYLLQRFEDYSGVAILATNLRSHIDSAFARRFQAMVHFPVPNAEQRLILWEGNFVDKPFELSDDVNLERLAVEYELTGGAIVNVLRYASLKAVGRRHPVVFESDLLHGISRERLKEGRLPRSEFTMEDAVYSD